MDKETLKKANELTCALDIADADLRLIREALDAYQTPMVKILRAEIHVKVREQTSESSWCDDEEKFRIDRAVLIETLTKQASKLERYIEKKQDEFDNL